MANKHDAEKVWSRRKQDVAAVVWPSFIVACAATFMAFGTFDPLHLAEAATPPWTIERMTGYAIGFFTFWVLCAVSSTLSLFMIRTSGNR